MGCGTAAEWNGDDRYSQPYTTDTSTTTWTIYTPPRQPASTYRNPDPFPALRNIPPATTHTTKRPRSPDPMYMTSTSVPGMTPTPTGGGGGLRRKQAHSTGTDFAEWPWYAFVLCLILGAGFWIGIPVGITLYVLHRKKGD